MSQPDNTDIELLNNLLEGNKKAFETIYTKYWSRLFLYAYKIFGDKGICEDIVQDVFIKLWENASKSEIQHLEAYLFRAVKYRISNAIRNLKHTAQVENVLALLPKELAADCQMELEETNSRIHQSVEQLPEKCRQVFILSREEQLSNRQIANQMNISVRTVEAHIYKALKTIKSSIGGIYFWICPLIMLY